MHDSAATGNRDRILHLRVSEEEYDLLRDAAGEVPLTTWLRVLGLNVARGGTWGRQDDTFVGDRWVPFLDLFPGGLESLATSVADEEVRSALARRGVYVVARFARSPTTAPDVNDPAVVYIGETHGRTSNLRSRLLQFGRSAGLFTTGRKDGHYAAWSFATEDGLPVPASEVYVALLPVPMRVAPRGDLHGIWPLLAESALLWARASHAPSGRLPPLNSNGAQGMDAGERNAAYVREWRQQRDEGDVDALFGETGAPRRAAAQRILVTIARGVWGYRSPRVYFTEHRDGAYARCHLAAGAWLYVGWEVTGRAFVSIWTDSACEFGESPGQDPAEDAAGFERLVETLLTTYV